MKKKIDNHINKGEQNTCWKAFKTVSAECRLGNISDQSAEPVLNVTLLRPTRQVFIPIHKCQRKVRESKEVNTQSILNDSAGIITSELDIIIS